MLARRDNAEQIHNSPRASHRNIGNIHKRNWMSNRVAEKHKKPNATQNNARCIFEKHLKNMLPRRDNADQIHNSQRANHRNICNIHKCNWLSNRVTEKHQKPNATQNNARCMFEKYKKKHARAAR